ncbi:MAG: TMEM14 family protein [Candidatus Kapaibacterium sp.]
MRSVALYQMLLGILLLVVSFLGLSDEGSTALMVGGIVIGLNLIFLGLRMQKGWRPSLSMSLIVGLLMAVYFGKVWLIDGGEFFPAILMTILSLLSIILVTIILVQPKERKRDF